MNTNLTSFISNSNVLVTGGTGFLGKILIEKLLRSQTNINKLYVLIRPKDGKSVQERLHSDIIDKQIFDKIKQENANFASKIIVIKGDICQAQFGLNDADRTVLLDEINIVYNCAGSTNVDGTFKDTMNSNCRSVAELLMLCREMKDLKSVVLLSPIHANYLNRKIIDEKIYDSPVNASLILDICEYVNDELLQEIEKSLLSGYPNAYTFSKLIMEKLVLDKFSDLPIIIFRSALVISSYENPLPGWTEDNQQIVNMAYKIHSGILRTLNLNLETKTHLVPADYCVNALICSSWHGARKRIMENNNKIPVYNYVFERRKRTWRFYLNTTLETDVKLGNMMWPPTYISSNSIYLYYILRFFLHFLPGAFMDACLLVAGYEAKYLTLYDDLYANLDKLAYVFNGEWKCRETNVTEMLTDMSSEDHQNYAVDVSKIRCAAYAKTICTGIKLYLAKQSLEANEKHLNRHKRLAYLQSGFKYIFWGVTSFLAFLVLRKIHSVLWEMVFIIFA